MDLNQSLANVKTEALVTILNQLVTTRLIQKPLLSKVKKELYQKIVEEGPGLRAVKEKKYYFLDAMLTGAIKNVAKGYISTDVTRKIIKDLVAGALLGGNNSEDIKQAFKKKYGEMPPHFLVISPTINCNKRCEGCYAAVGKEQVVSLPYSVLDKMLEEAHDKFGCRFITVSGGEPFMYRDGNKTLFDLWEKYNDIYFLVYTNGSLITPEAARKLAELGNVTPGISVEGFKKETDKRRGEGTFEEILTAFKNLREAGVPFGISATATRQNAEVLMKEKFFKFYFDEQGASYMWQFQLMPIGKGRDVMGSMLTPEQRVKLYKVWAHQIKDKKRCVADFWNAGVLSNGCVAYGGNSGYLYIDWNGNIMPCVFVPYYVDNIKDLQAQGKGLTDAMFSKFFKRGRAWQKEYGVDNVDKPHNWLMPCSIRDHFENFKKNIYCEGVKPENTDAALAIKSKEYEEEMKKFDTTLAKLTDPIWEKDYLKKK
ncbi:Radical SAM superfamily protein [uncultured archaeon]|nr:Radical SAM superfamily protein [uncultured archaeon]